MAEYELLFWYKDVYRKERQMIDMLPPQVRGFRREAEKDYEGFWENGADNAADDIYWFKRWDEVFEWNYPAFRWYVGGMTNISYDCIDYKVEQGNGGKAALIHESGETGEVRVITYAQLLTLLRNMPLRKGVLGCRRVIEWLFICP